MLVFGLFCQELVIQKEERGEEAGAVREIKRLLMFVGQTRSEGDVGRVTKRDCQFLDFSKTLKSQAELPKPRPGRLAWHGERIRSREATRKLTRPLFR